MKKPDQKERNQVLSGSKQTQQSPVSSKGDVQQFLSKVASMPKAPGEARLIFSLDATASRQPTWDVASQLQADMFASTQTLGGLNVQLCYFRGFGEFYSSDWHSNSDELLNIMAQIRCEAGATQIEKLLRHAIKENGAKKIKAVVYIGDAMEENIDRLAQLAGTMGLRNIPLFMFQERNDPIAQNAYIELCRLSGGAYSHFDAASAAQLKELLSAVAVYAAGGLKALEDFCKGSSKSRMLLEQLKP